jgi:hypothetical protein
MPMSAPFSALRSSNNTGGIMRQFNPCAKEDYDTTKITKKMMKL